MDELPYHMDQMHGAKDKGAKRGQGPSRKKGTLTADHVERMKAFYENVLMQDEDYPGKPKSRKRKASGEDETVSSSDSDKRGVKKYKLETTDIADLEAAEHEARLELFKIQRRLAMLRRRESANEA